MELTDLLIVVVVVVVAVNFDGVDSKLVTGSVSTTEDWVFLERFCFLSENGRLRFQFAYPTNVTAPKLLTYFDDQWPLVYRNNDRVCRQKEAVLRPENNQVFFLSQSEGWTGCRRQPDGSSVACTGSLGFLSHRERWWYIVVSNCDSERLEFTYEMTLTNGDGPMQRHFSADEFYILEVDIAFLLATLTLFVLSCVCAAILHEQKYLHVTYKLFVCSLAFDLLHLFVISVVLGKYSADGLENYPAKVVAHVLEAAGVLLFVLLLMMVGKGLTVTRGRISAAGSTKLSVFMTLYGVVYVGLFVWEAAAFDKGLVLYRFESFPGYCLLAMRIVAWIWFSYAVYVTLKHYPEKMAFYYPFFAFYTLWFWAGPIVVVAANKAMPLWTREKVANGIFLTINFLGFAFLLFLTRPSKANKNFPYHVKTTQVSMLESDTSSDLCPYAHQAEGVRLDFVRGASSSESVDPGFYDIFSIAGSHGDRDHNRGVTQA